MANFEMALKRSSAIEGGYVNDPRDAGGETWIGISRVFHPNWPGWVIIDEEKKNGLEGLGSRLMDILALDPLEDQFYREQFWNRFNGDVIPQQAIAEELFDTSVNMGVHRAVVFLQGALNLLNRNQKDYPDILEDGVFGPATLNTLKIHLEKEKNNPSALLKIMSTLQGMHYVEYMRKHPEQERFARGWMKRA